MHPLFTIQNIRQENTYQNHRVWCDCWKGCSFPPNHRLSHSQWIYHWPPLSLSHNSLIFNILLPAQWKLGTKVTLLLLVQSLFFVIRTHYFLFQSFLGPESFLSRLYIFFVGLPLPTTLPFFPPSVRLCVARISMFVVRFGSLTNGQAAPSLINS